MLVIFIRTSIIFITLMVIMRLMGKRQIGEMQPFEFIITLIIADLACIPMADVSIPLVYGIVAILALFILHQLMFLIEKGGNICQKIVSGKPSVIINKQGIDIKELKKNNIDIEDLVQAMRAQGYFAFDDLDYAIFESNGKLSALAKANLNKSQSIPLLVISEGKLNKEVIVRQGIPQKTVEDFLKKQKATVKDTEILTIDSFGKVYFQKKHKKYEILRIELPKDAIW